MRPMPDAESPVQPRISSRNRSAGAIAEIESPAFAVLLPGRGTPLPSAKLNRSFDAIGALAGGAAYQALKIVYGRKRPVFKSAQVQVAAVALRLKPTQA